MEIFGTESHGNTLPGAWWQPPGKSKTEFTLNHWLHITWMVIVSPHLFMVL